MMDNEHETTDLETPNSSIENGRLQGGQTELNEPAQLCGRIEGMAIKDEHRNFADAPKENQGDSEKRPRFARRGKPKVRTGCNNCR